MKKSITKSQLYLKKHTPIILAFMGSIGVIVTTVTAVKATPKALLLLEEATDEKGEELTNLEVVKTAGRVYIPTVLLGTTTIACIFGVNALNKKNQALLTSAYAMLNESFKRYRSAANAVFGNDADSKIQAETAKDVYVNYDGYGILPEDDYGDTLLFYDSLNQRYFNSTMASVVNAIYHFNRNLALRGIGFVNELYEFLGIDYVDFGDDLGWNMGDLSEDGIMWLDFDIRKTQLEDGLECYILSSLIGPTITEDEYAK